MKTILTVVAAAVLAMGFTGCSDKKTNEPETPKGIKEESKNTNFEIKRSMAANPSDDRSPIRYQK